MCVGISTTCTARGGGRVRVLAVGSKLIWKACESEGQVAQLLNIDQIGWLVAEIVADGLLHGLQS